MRLLILGATGPTGILLVREALAAFEATLILYVRSPAKIPDDLSSNPQTIVIQGQLDDLDGLSKAMEGVDVVLSALGPSQFSQPSGTPLAHAYERIIETMQRHQVDRLIALGTASIGAPEDKFNLTYSLMVKSVSISMRNAYKDILAIAAVIQASNLDWTIVRVPILSNDTSRDVIVGYIGDGKTKNTVTLSRLGFAAFVVEEVTKKQWHRKLPLLVSA
ncbi:NADH(P)-binding-domain-containing protein [Mycena sp. CBHHK59/15]|nr:NADH(P)-binding-domain-containing protein [Mycena sp. CBHHK59/15]